ncbi:unnamed protein product [Parnassius apollo]|uniref:(apollo) hypothetical protein n=1 Tax=Parnassius apollo TaxID=110799 RepID=A0A8S3Y6V8_PARAO|nr:unnamed protein product [Parnassius apollo]
MYLSLKISFISILACIVLNLNVLGNNDDDSKVKNAFIASNVVPDVISAPPFRYISIKYPSGVEVDLGNKLASIEVRNKPTVKWEADRNTFYTLALVGEYLTT